MLNNRQADVSPSQRPRLYCRQERAVTMSKGLVLIDQQTKNTLTVTIRYTRFILPLFDLKVLSSHSIHQDQNTPIITYKKKKNKNKNKHTNKQTNNH